MSTGINTVGDLLRRVFDVALDAAKERVCGVQVEDAITREDLEQAIVQLRFDVMGLAVHQLDMLRALGELQAAEAYRRGREQAEGASIEIIEPTGDEPTTKPFKR